MITRRFFQFGTVSNLLCPPPSLLNFYKDSIFSPLLNNFKLDFLFTDEISRDRIKIGRINRRIRCCPTCLSTAIGVYTRWITDLLLLPPSRAALSTLPLSDPLEWKSRTYRRARKGDGSRASSFLRFEFTINRAFAVEI